MPAKRDNNCAVHEVRMTNLEKQLERVNDGQKEVKELLTNYHSENLAYLDKISARSNRAIHELQIKLEKEIGKFYDRDRIMTEKIAAVEKKQAVHTALAIGAATILSFAIQFSRVVDMVVK